MDDDVFRHFRNTRKDCRWSHCFCLPSPTEEWGTTRYGVELADEPGVYYISQGPSTFIDKRTCKKYNDIEQAKMHLMLM